MLQTLLLTIHLFLMEKVALVERHVKLIGDEVSMNLIIESDLNSIDGDQFLMTHVTNPLVQSKPLIEQLVNFGQICKMEHLIVCSLSIKCRKGSTQKRGPRSAMTLRASSYSMLNADI